MPLHCPSHNVKKVVQQYGICAVFSAPCKHKKVCPLLTRTRRELSCKKNHQMKFTSCVPNVIYEIPLSCGWSYIGQTSWCFNKRAQEHSYPCTVALAATLPCKRCDCQNVLPHLDKTKFLSKAKSRTEREVIEAFHIAKRGDSCVSSACISLSRNEIELLD